MIDKFIAVPTNVIRFRKVILSIFCILTLIFLALGYTLVMRSSQRIGNPPTDFQAENVEFKSKTGRAVRGWFVPGKIGQGGVLLLHGIRSNRLGMLERGKFLSRSGYAVLLIDLQAHGESDGDVITLGLRESHDAAAGVDYLSRRIGSSKVFAIGQSLGGAALILAEPPLALRALVVEAVFPDVAEALENRLRIRIGMLSPLVKELLLLELKLLLGIDPKSLRPIDRIATVGFPIFIISGDADRHTTPDETRRLYQHASQPKKLWMIQGAAHEDLHRAAGREYEERILEFFERYAEGASPPFPVSN